MRTFLDGRFENSAFCLLAPNGQDWLSRAGRGPEMVLGHSAAARQMATLAEPFPVLAELSDAIVPDFHSTRQALNVASADQRLLVLINGPANTLDALRKSLRRVATDRRIIGRFHYDFETGNEWKENVFGTADSDGIVLIRPGEFGMDGVVVKQMPLHSSNADIIASLVSANLDFSKTTVRKVYSDHVAKGQSLGIHFEGAVPYGEDRDGDGQIDRGRPSSRRTPRR